MERFLRTCIGIALEISFGVNEERGMYAIGVNYTRCMLFRNCIPVDRIFLRGLSHRCSLILFSEKSGAQLQRQRQTRDQPVSECLQEMRGTQLSKKDQRGALVLKTYLQCTLRDR